MGPVLWKRPARLPFRSWSLADWRNFGVACVRSLHWHRVEFGGPPETCLLRLPLLLLSLLPMSHAVFHLLHPRVPPFCSWSLAGSRNTRVICIGSLHRHGLEFGNRPGVFFQSEETGCLKIAAGDLARRIGLRANIVWQIGLLRLRNRPCAMCSIHRVNGCSGMS
ncbi:hypothetical protein IWZ01DRAFT_506472 [Phyllosticta capitalensis]